jgi:hypothetical protein
LRKIQEYHEGKRDLESQYAAMIEEERLISYKMSSMKKILHPETESADAAKSKIEIDKKVNNFIG